MTTSDADDYENLVEAVMAFAREIALRERDSDAVSLKSSSSHVLRYINDHPGATPSETAAATGLLRSNLSTALRELEGLGFVERSPHEDDGRGVRLHSTEKAERNLAKLHALWAESVEGVLTTADGVAAATEVLRRASRGLANDRRQAAERERRRAG